MADDLDDLMGSFFNEIKSIEEVPAPKLETPVPVISSQETIVVSAEPVVAMPKIIAKPADIVHKVIETTTAQSHPVYTYDYGDYDMGESNSADPQGSQTDFDAASSRQLSSYSTFSSSSSGHVNPLPQVPRQNKVFVRAAAGEIWKDETLNEWPENDFRIFVGDLAKEVTSDILGKHFQIYKSFAKAKVIRTKHENKARGYGFVSFLDPMDCAKAILVSYVTISSSAYCFMATMFGSETP